MISLKDAEKFHGHLGPWLVLGLLMGKHALRILKADKYFGVEVKAWGANKRPKSCLIDGLQLSTGATYGKGNIHKFNGSKIKVFFRNLKNNKEINIALKETLTERLDNLKGHNEYESFARKLYSTKPANIFQLTTDNRQPRTK